MNANSAPIAGYLRKDDTLRLALIWWPYPIDEPPVVRAAGLTLTLETWRREGWEWVDREPTPHSSSKESR